MSRYILDLIFDERSGDVKVVVDFHDPSLTSFEINQAIREGELREELLGVVAQVLGNELAERVRGGEVDMVCLDDQPELRPRPTTQPLEPAAVENERLPEEQ